MSWRDLTTTIQAMPDPSGYYSLAPTHLAAFGALLFMLENGIKKEGFWVIEQEFPILPKRQVGYVLLHQGSLKKYVFRIDEEEIEDLIGGS